MQREARHSPQTATFELAMQAIHWENCSSSSGSQKGLSKQPNMRPGQPCINGSKKAPCLASSLLCLKLRSQGAGHARCEPVPLVWVHGHVPPECVTCSLAACHAVGSLALAADGCGVCVLLQQLCDPATVYGRECEVSLEKQHWLSTMCLEYHCIHSTDREMAQKRYNGTEVCCHFGS